MKPQVVLVLLEGPRQIATEALLFSDGYRMLVRWTDDRTGEKRQSGPFWAALRYTCRIWQLTALEVVVDSTKLPQPA